jgi:hypothetical protein
MYLSTHGTGERNYMFQDTVDDDIQDNVRVCAGTFSGSNSNYFPYKSNCFSLMTDRCAKQWDESCSLYVNDINDQEARIFMKSMQPRTYVHVAPSIPPYQMGRIESNDQPYRQMQYDNIKLKQAQQQQPYIPLSLYQPDEIGISKSTPVSYEPMNRQFSDVIQQQEIERMQRLHQQHMALHPHMAYHQQQVIQNDQKEQEQKEQEQKQALREELFMVQQQEVSRLQQEEADRIQEQLIHQEELRVRQEKLDQEMARQHDTMQREIVAEQERVLREQISHDTQQLQIEQNQLEQSRINQIKDQQYKEQVDDSYDFMTKGSECSHSCDVSKLL